MGPSVPQEAQQLVCVCANEFGGAADCGAVGPKDYGLSAADAGVASVGRDTVFNAHLVL